jgi:hypothetical protein
MRHAHGATRLIQLRGPETYHTEFEKALFLAHSGPIVSTHSTPANSVKFLFVPILTLKQMTESLLNNEKCFLAQPAWRAVFQSLVVPGPLELSDRSETAVSLLILKSRVSALFADVTLPVCNPNDYEPMQLNLLVSQASALRADLLLWRSNYEHLLAYTPVPCVSIQEYDKRCEIMSTYISCSMISNRLLIAVSFGSAGSASLEEETQLLAAHMLELEMQVKDVCPHMKLFLAQTVFVAKATIATAGDWVAESAGNRDETVIEKWKFERWCALFGRRVS